MSQAVTSKTKTHEQELTSQLNKKHNINTLINTQTQNTKPTNYETSQSTITVTKQPAPLVRSAYDGLRLSVDHYNSEPSLTDQSQKDECDVNQIIERFTKTGTFEHLNHSQPVYGDFSDIPDYQSSLLKIQAAQDAFAQLNAKLRAKFGNDPANFVEFVQNPANADEMVELGLATRPPEATITKIKEPEGTPTKVPTKASKSALTTSTDE